MLKIKDDVDLKELEKFGFKEQNYINGITYKYEKINGNYETMNIIIGRDRIIHYNQESVFNEIDSVIYDLIQANLVEKVEE
jgi:hypothetical protein